MIARYLMLISILATLTSCEQNIRQQVTVDNTKQTELIEKLVDKITASNSPSSSKPTTTTTTTTTQATITMPLPQESTPTNNSINSTTGFDFKVFQTSIPNPKETQTWLKTEIKQALDNWRVRYQNAKSDPFAVVNMAIDARLMASKNFDLTRELLLLISSEPNPDDSFVGGIEGVLSYLQSVSSTMELETGLMFNLPYNTRLRTLDYSNLEMRKLTVERVNDKGEYFITENPDDLAPEVAKEGDQVIYIFPYKIPNSPVFPETTYFLKVIVLYENSSWKVLAETLSKTNFRTNV